VSRDTILRFDDVSMHFGGIKAIDGVSFEVEEGRIFGIIGPNGAGKTTIFNVISGVYVPSSGTVSSGDLMLNKLPPHRITGALVGRTFQNIRLFDDQTVLDNLKIAQYSKTRYSLADVLVSSRRLRSEEKRIHEEAMAILGSLGLSDKAETKAGALPYGEQRRVEIARALASKPKILLLDEPAAGMNPSEIDSLNALIVGIRDDWELTILLVEHQMRLVMEVCEEILVLNFGKKLALGKPDEIKNDERVLEAYLGKAHKHE
jgi:branched-chain amino acid transport system ATP-binding protein